VTASRPLLAYVLLAIGTLWLLVEVGFVPPRLTLALLEWWPLLLVALGLDLLVPAARRGPLPVTVYAASGILLLGVLGVSGRRATAAEPLEHALQPDMRSLTALIDPGSARARIGPAAAGELVTAAFEGPAPAEARVTGDSEPTLTLRQGRTRGPQLRRLAWDVALTAELPLDLTLRTGSGGAETDLTALDLAGLTVDGGSGALELALPGGGRFYRVGLTTGSGSARVRVAPGASLDIDADTGSGSLHLEVGHSTDLQLTLDAGSGAVTLDLPDDAPIRLDVTDDGSGRLNLPGYLVRRSGSGDTGVWQSAAFERGGRVILVRVVGAGSGSITVR